MILHTRKKGGKTVLGGSDRCKLKTDGPYNFSDELIFISNIAAINMMQPRPRNQHS